MNKDESAYKKTLEGWGKQRAASRSSFLYLKKFERKFQVKHPSYNKAFEIKHFKNENSKGVVFFIPGVFSGLNSVDVLRLSELIHKNGYESFILPNPLSEDYYRSDPAFVIGDFEQEAKGLSEIVDIVINRFDLNNKLKHIVGISYGAYFSSIIANHVPFSKVVLLSPPFNIGESLTEIDKQIGNHSWKLDGSQFRTVIKLFLADRISMIPELSEQESQHFMWAAGFHRSLQKLFSFRESVKENKKFSDFYLKVIRKDIARELESLNFVKAMAKVNPFFDIEKKEHALSFWTKNLNTENLWVVTSKDDMINKSFFKPSELKNLTLYESGGHYGYREEEDFLRLFNGIFDLPD